MVISSFFLSLFFENARCGAIMTDPLKQPPRRLYSGHWDLPFIHIICRSLAYARLRR
jgi:hypothetical protein